MTKVEFNIYPYINKKTYLTLEYEQKMSGGFKFPKYKINYTILCLEKVKDFQLDLPVLT